MSTAIRIDQVSKEYRLGTGPGYGRLSELIQSSPRRLARWLLRKPAPPLSDRMWAVKDISLRIAEGEAVGVIGRNGAGKSTLLKIMSRITRPTQGRIGIRGRVGSLLEVGTGFHPELTGRENIFLNGAILGMSRADIRKRFDEIVSFAEIERFLETPVKHYSSGMYTRLAFAVAAHLEPDILIVDEVLAVGDAPFQRKCLARMSEISRGGRTVLFVSHNLQAVSGLCQRAILLSGGQVSADGSPEDVIRTYQEREFRADLTHEWPDRDTAPGNENVRLRRAAVVPPADVGVIDVQTPLRLEFEYWSLTSQILNPSVVLLNENGILVLNTFPTTDQALVCTPQQPGLYRSSLTIPANLLNNGLYEVQLLLVVDHTIISHRWDRLLQFEVHDSRPAGMRWFGAWPGAVRPNLHWDCERAE